MWFSFTFSQGSIKWMYGTEVCWFGEKGIENPFVTSETSLSAWAFLTEWCLPWWKAMFIFLSWTTLTSCREGICRRSQLRLMDYVKYAEDVWETDIFCLTWMILEIKPIRADRQSDDFADTREVTVVMKQGRRVQPQHKLYQQMYFSLQTYRDIQSVNLMGLTF